MSATPEQIAERNARREVQLALTYRMAGVLLSLVRAGRRKSARQHEANKRSGWTPEPGRYDANLARVGIMDDIIAQLEPQVASQPEADDGNKDAQQS